jgi:crotonobetainyl-CoA:carnitine CoA-transferase CaiB-like acyl-CoA transferase
MRGSLEGIRVLELARVIAGPHCSMILGDLGAEVIKVEKPGTGDMSRQNQPTFNDESTYFMAHNRNKKSITLDFRHPDAKALFLKLVKKADVVVENFRAGTMEVMKLGYDELSEANLGIILTRISGFGQDGPYSHRTCFDQVAQAISGLMDVTGPEDGPPFLVGTYVVDCAGALYAVIGTLAALRAREKTGKGQVVDVALLDTAVSLLHTAIPDYQLLGQKLTRIGNNDRYAWPASIYRASNGRWVYIHAGMDNTFSALMKIIGREELLKDERYNTRKAREANKQACDDLIQSWVSTLPAEEVVEIVSRAGIPSARINDVTEMIADPQVNHRGMVAKVDHPKVGELHLAGPVVHLSDTKASIQSAPPLLGEHNNEVYGGLLSLSDKEIASMSADGLI